MSTAPSTPVPPAQPPPLIRQVALVMLLLCLLVPAALLLRPGPSTPREHEPAKARAAMAALFASIELPGGAEVGGAAQPAGAAPRPLPDAAALARALPECAALPPHQGLPIMEDLAEQLGLLDQQLAALSAEGGRHNALLRQRPRLNTERWLQSLHGGAVGCAQAAQALRSLASPRGRALLMQARWREHLRGGATLTAAGQALPAVELGPKSLAQVDPWRGWPGCIWLGGLAPGEPAYYLAGAAAASGQGSLCEQDGMRPPGHPVVAVVAAATDAAAPGGVSGGVSVAAAVARGHPSWFIPKDLGSLLSELDGLRRPEGGLYSHYAANLSAGANRRSMGRNEVDVGFNLHLTIEPKSQALAQQAVECYTGNSAACGLLGIDLASVGAAQGPGPRAMWEQAAARMSAVAIIDVASGRIEALASAHTPCHAQENDGPFRDAGCLPLWTRPQRRPDALLNHAVFGDYLPGSTIKPILASVFFEDAATPAESLSRWLATSDTQRFNDELFCLNLPKSQACDRPARVQQRAADLGWNADCSEQPNARCAQADLLFGRRLSTRLAGDDGALAWSGATPLQRPALVGRLFAEPALTAQGPGQRLMALGNIDRQAAAQCRVNGQWHADQCSSAAMKPLVNEAEGQGQARATALGVATMVARIAAAANGQTSQRRPHLVAQITDAQGHPVSTAATRTAANGNAVNGTAGGAAKDSAFDMLAAPEPITLRPEVARQVLQAMGRGTQAKPGQTGTAHLICRHVFGARCAEMAPRLAGKTGTPSFPLDQHSLASARAHCLAHPRDGACSARPVKWYVAAYASQPGSDATAARKDKVIAVISERNWYRNSPDVPAAQRGHIHGVDDLNNISTEVAMRVLAAQWGIGKTKP